MAATQGQSTVRDHALLWSILSRLARPGLQSHQTRSHRDRSFLRICGLRDDVHAEYRMVRYGVVSHNGPLFTDVPPPTVDGPSLFSFNRLVLPPKGGQLIQKTSLHYN